MKLKLITRSLSNHAEIPLSGMLKLNRRSIRVLVFTAITLAAIIVRLYISFAHELILGMDGGYYPLQVRNILSTGFLSFNDVPLYFYFCAFLLKVTSLLGFAVTDETIISVIKIVDSTALPLLAIPLFKILTKRDQNLPLFSEVAILFFAIFSFSPFIMLGDLQKNAFAIPLFLTFFYFLEGYLTTPTRWNLIVTLFALFIIAFTHFGTFAFGLAFLCISFFVAFGRKAILPSLITIAIGCAIITLFDFNRAFRILTFWNVIFSRHIEFQGPMFVPILLNWLISYALAIFGVLQYQKQKHSNDKITGYVTLSLVVLIFIFAFPFYESQYVQRFHVMLFIPQSLLIFNLIRMNNKLTLPFSISLVLITLASGLIYFHEEKKPCIDELAYRDLQNIKPLIPEERAGAIIIARHGIEFWTAWNLNMKVGNDRSIDKLGLEKYKNIIYLQQKNEERQGQLGRRRIQKPTIGEGGHPPLRPLIPENFKLVYSSPYFNAYQNLN